jgi:hypothetical protein
VKRCGRGRKGVQKVCSTKGYPLGVSFMVRDSRFFWVSGAKVSLPVAHNDKIIPFMRIAPFPKL